ncbi:hypothetical protein NW762_013722 [Fusarium torreyae]|uniref:protein S-acyltransferase n=1 Tax=Fusarium torreyae TaxID=1237075 RepID=A0A9W8RMY6_9HYPO|nr:hypothetical protein NW762_013722 [Fusarium torreyae]
MAANSMLGVYDRLGGDRRVPGRPVSANDLRMMMKEIEDDGRDLNRRASAGSDTLRYQFTTHDGAQYNNTGNGSQFLGTHFYGDVKFIHNVEGPGQSRKDKEVQILKRLGACPYRDRKDRNPAAFQGTCEWFISHQTFDNWLNGGTSNVLWVSADPGCGKSVLVKHLADSIIHSTASRKVSYFFFKDDFEDQRSILSALCCILHQLFLEDNSLLTDDILLLFEDINGQRITESVAELWQTVIKVADNNPDMEFLCLIDAIDECDSKERSTFFQAITDLYGSGKCPNIKLLITSRPYQEISAGFQPLEGLKLPVIHLSGESDVEMDKIAGEIDIVIRERAKNIALQKRLTPDEQDILTKRLLHVQHRTYLWVHLTLDLIERELDINKTKLISITSQLPQTVDEAYDRIMSKTRNRVKATKMLHLILAAERPLTLTEMSVALELEGQHHMFKSLDLEPEGRFREKIRDLCGLVTVIDSRVFLLHQTVKEFLVSSTTTTVSHKDLIWKQTLNPGSSNSILAHACIRYLLLADLNCRFLKLAQSSPSKERRNDFIDYAANYWAHHFNKLPINIQASLMDSAMCICDPRSACYSVWFPVYWYSTNSRVPGGFNTLMTASYFGIDVVVKHLLKDRGLVLDQQDIAYKRSALSWAAGKGHTDVVRRLIRGMPIGKRFWRIELRPGADVNLRDKDGRTPLFYAVWAGNAAAVQMLVDGGARTDIKDVVGGTPTEYAVSSGYQEVAKILLQAGGSIHTDPNAGERLLLSAVQKGQQEVVQWLLGSGTIDVNAADKNGSTCLLWAVDLKNITIVKSLLESGADVNIGDKDGWTPLQQAVKFNDLALVQWLIEGGGDMNLLGGDDTTPLTTAIFSGQDDIVQMMLRTRKADIRAETQFQIARQSNCATLRLMLNLYGLNINASDQNGDTLLISAIKGRWYSKFEAILNSNKVDVNARDKDGNTALHHIVYAAGAGGMVDTLLSREDVDVNARNQKGRTPIALGCSTGCIEIVHSLLKTGRADVEIPDSKGGTPLLVAGYQGEVEILRLLLTTVEVEVNIRDHEGRTALAWAANNGHEEAVRSLLGWDHVEVNTRDNSGRTPLCLAVVEGNENVVGLLLNTTGVDAEVKDDDGRTALALAAMRGAFRIVQLFLNNRRANIYAGDTDGRTPLLLAAEKGRKDVVRLLLATKYVDVDARDSQGRTALSLAAGAGQEGMVRLLLDHGQADAHARDYQGRKALWWATTRSDNDLRIVKLLEEAMK